MENQMVWYAAYGSNICRERFLCYIKGGAAKGSDKHNLGCRDRTLPVRDEELYIQSALYFANVSSAWGGRGVGFLKNEFGGNAQTFGRMYLITAQQFIDVVKQETNQEHIEIDFQHAAITGGYVFRKHSWYGKIIFLGEQHGHPIFTFTSEKDLRPNAPSSAYLQIIAQGIREVFPVASEELAGYFLNCEGVTGNFSEKELIEIIDS